MDVTDVPSRFTVVREIGRGAFGVVFEAQDAELGATVALKRSPASSAPRRMPPRHPNLVRIHDVTVVGATAWTSMERIDGVDVMTWVRPPRAAAPHVERPLPHPLLLGQPTQDAGVSAFTAASREEVQRLRAVLPQLAAGLVALHRAAMLHRDLRPSNVLVERGTERVVLLDFDLADDLAGSPAYMAPEQGRDEAPTPKIDWYALGVLLFEALTGALPFFGNAQEVILRKQTGSAPSPSFVVDLSAAAADDLDALCTRLLRREPSVRAGEAEVLAALGYIPPQTSSPA